jgi:hypothetical protein
MYVFRECFVDNDLSELWFVSDGMVELIESWTSEAIKGILIKCDCVNFVPKVGYNHHSLQFQSKHLLLQN